MKLKELFRPGTRGVIDNRKLIDLLRQLRKVELPAEVVERAKQTGREKFLAEAKRVHYHKNIFLPQAEDVSQGQVIRVIDGDTLDCPKL